MKHAIVLKHAEFEGPARIADLVRELGYGVEVRAVYQGDAVPPRLDAGDVLIVMGGPMGVGDLENSKYPFLHEEVALLRRCIEDDAPVLGVCLGAQLLAHAAGAHVYPMHRDAGARLYEVGWAPLRFLLEDGDDVHSGLPAEAPFLHWHGDTFDLPAGATLLASSALCRNQAFRLGRRRFGLQFHCEVERAQVEDFLRADADFVTLANGDGGLAELRADTARYVDGSRQVGDALLRNILRAMTRS